jgi:urease accessory protein
MPPRSAARLSGAAGPDPGAAAPGPAAGWRARLELRFARRVEEPARTVLASRRHEGPLAVQRAFYPEADGTCHVYLLHPPGGVAGGDELAVDVQAEPGASVLLTTPAAGKVYRSAGAVSRQRQVLRVAAQASLEWLPQETIVFDGALAELSTAVWLESDARFTGWEVLCLGRPAAGERFLHGRCGTRLEVYRDGRPLLLERGRYEGGAAVLSAPWGLAGYPVCATLVATAEPGAVEAARAAVTEWGEGRFGVTGLNGLLVARYLGQHGDVARGVLTRIWDLLRRAQGRAAHQPRIWRT